MNLRTVTKKELREALENVTDAVSDTLTYVVNGHPDTGSQAVSAVNVVVYNDGNVTTRISGLVNKVTLFGALVEAILSLHELEKANQVNEISAIVDALAEKELSNDRTDN